jgi:hypothetical protein
MSDIATAYSDLASSRVIGQYRSAPKFNKWLQLYVAKGGSLASTYGIMSQMLDVDTSIGQQLDVIGRIVGVARPYFTEVPGSYFGYINDAGDPPTSNPYLVGPYIGPETQTSQNLPLNDALFRAIIRAKIVSNNSFVTTDDIILAFEFIAGIDVVELIDGEDMTFSIVFAQEPAFIVRQVMVVFAGQILPTPAGVKYTGFTVA